MLMRTGVAVVVAFAAWAAPASAAVLISAPEKHPACGDPIVPGIWSQPGTKGSRTVRIKLVDRRSGKTYWHRKAKAPFSHWRYWTLASGKGGLCKPTTLVYKGPGFTSRYKITFHSEGV